MRSDHADFLVGLVDLLLLLLVLGPAGEHVAEQAQDGGEIGVHRLDAEACLELVLLAVLADEAHAHLAVRQPLDLLALMVAVDRLAVDAPREREHDAAGGDHTAQRGLAERSAHAAGGAVLDDLEETTLVDLGVEAVDHLHDDGVLSGEVALESLLEPRAILALEELCQAHAERLVEQGAVDSTELDLGEARDLRVALHLLVVLRTALGGLGVVARPEQVDGARDVHGQEVVDAGVLELRHVGVLEEPDDELDERVQPARPALTTLDPLETGKHFGLGHRNSPCSPWAGLCDTLR